MTRYSKIALVNPPIDKNKFRCIDAGHWQPLNLLTIASYLLECGYKGEVKIFDQEIMERSQLIHELLEYSPDLAGISPNIDSYLSTIEISKKSKLQNCDIVIGGNYATNLSKIIIANRSEIDYVISRDGEIPFKELVFGHPLSGINNLVYKSDNIVISNKINHNINATLSEIDYSLIDLNKYFKNYLNSPNVGPFKKPISFLSQRGCIWKDKTGGCVFCSRELGSRFDDVNKVWSRIRKLQEKFGIDSIMDVSDDFLGNVKWFESFYENKPSDLDNIGIRFIYSRVNHITEINAERLSKLGTFEVFLGIESGDQNILKQTIKGNTINQHLKAIQRLEKNNINVALGIVVGLPGETQNSLIKTFKHVERLLKFSNINEIVVSCMTPLPGSPSYNMMIGNSSISQKYLNHDIVPVLESQIDWLNNYTSINLNDVLRIMGSMENLSSKVTTEFKEVMAI